MMSSSMMNACFNSNCKHSSSSHNWRRGWRRRTGDYSNLCDRCATAYEEGKFCETFHVNTSGWRCCESCGKKIHCGCIVSFHMFVLLDAGGIECLTCAKKSYVLTPNPAWPPPPSHLLPSKPERMKDLPIKSWSSQMGSGSVLLHQTPSAFNGSSLHSDVHPSTPSQINLFGGGDGFRNCEGLTTVNGKPGFGSFTTHQNGFAGLNRKNNVYPPTKDFQPILSKNGSSLSNFSLDTASSCKTQTNDSHVATVSILADKNVHCHNGVNSSGETQVLIGRVVSDGRGRNNLLTEYRPQKAHEELQQLESEYPMVATGFLVFYYRDRLNLNVCQCYSVPCFLFSICYLDFTLAFFSSNSVITPLFEKTLTASDAGKIGRLVVPKKCAEAHFPRINHPEGVAIKVQDVKGNDWMFQFRFWSNNNSRMYVLEGITACIQSMQLQAGDVVTFSRLEPQGKLVIGGRKASTIPSSDQGNEGTAVTSGTSIPKKSGGVNFVNCITKRKLESSIYPTNQVAESDIGITPFECDKSGSVATSISKPKPVSKRNSRNLGVKSKRLKIENDDSLELNITWKEAQGLMRQAGGTVPSVFVVEGCELEEFQEEAPVIGRPTILWTDNLGEKTKWTQCEDCFKWRKVPVDAHLPSRWICSGNVWDHDRSSCSVTEEVSREQLQEMLCAISKVPPTEETTRQDTGLLALEGLDTLANLAIQNEGEGLPSSSETTTKHPRHKPTCACIVCLQPPSGKAFKHKQTCDCVVCNSTKRRFKTLMERREKKQLKRESEPEIENLLLQQLPEEQEGVSNFCLLVDNNESKCSDSSLKSQLDLNFQPEREEEFSRSSESFPVKCMLE